MHQKRTILVRGLSFPKSPCLCNVLYMFHKPYTGVKYFGVWAEETADTFGRRDALAVLADVRDRCRDEDMRNDHTAAALAYLERSATRTAAFRRFRKALDMTDPEERGQSIAATLQAIERQAGATR